MKNVEAALAIEHPDLSSRISTARLLVVGAGGIGCELLKNLVLSGFKDIQVIDLDTIDLSNLNRQFLFRNQHIGQSKAKVAAEVVLKMAPTARVVPYMANVITDARFSLSFFAQFDMVLNALDNLKARQHVNMMCVAAKVPLVESGTAGLLGQSTAHIPGVTECFDCLPHDIPKTFPVCTIRSTPSLPIHCIVWAKSFLFAQLFGETDPSTDASNASVGEDLEELRKLQEEAQSLGKLRDAVGSSSYVADIFDKVFNNDIKRLAAVDGMWKDRISPIAISYDEAMTKIGSSDDKKTGGTLERDHQKWSLEMTSKVFTDSCLALSDRLRKSGFLEFDKDDDQVMDFVTASANLRSRIFGIPEQSRFEAKQMAGNIIPAVATTNAVAAGLVVLKAFKILAAKQNELSFTYLVHGNGKNLLSSMKLSPRNLECQVCSNAYREVAVDLESCKLSDLIQIVVKDSLNLRGDIQVLRQDDSLIYDFDFEDNEEKTLTQLNITDGSRVTVIHEDDDNGGASVPLILFIKHELERSIPILNDTAMVPLKYMPPAPASILAQSSKRKLDDGEKEVSPVEKKLKVVEINDDGVLLID
eukprot:Partr_v1_DN27759_c3_g1_i4_m67300 putative ubiquitin-like modifier activating enzyme 2